MTEAGPSRGVYFLANDKIKDITLAFLNSFRLHNPKLPLCLIPFNDEFGQIAALADLYDFSIYHNAETLGKCDEIAKSLTGWECGAYRKFCAFDGPFEQFIYIDCDTLVLQSVDFFYGHLDRFDWVFTHSDMPNLRRYVWKETIDAAGLLSQEQIAFSANCGCFCSHRGAFDIDEALAQLPAVAAKFAAHMDFFYMDQPYMNYLAVTAPGGCSSLFKLMLQAGDFSGPHEHWAGAKEALGRDVFLLHWAGVWNKTEAERKFYRVLARFGLRVRSLGVRWAMPHKRLWKRYRFHRYVKPVMGD